MFKFMLTALLIVSASLRATDKEFVIFIASYNNEPWCEWNLKSVLSQKYKNFRIIYVDDCSKDRTSQVVQKIMRGQDPDKRITYIRNEQRQGAMYNQYMVVHNLCRDNEIIVIVDGDDALAGEGVLSYLNKVYSSGDIWLTYGQYVERYGGAMGWCQEAPHDLVKRNAFRKWERAPSHLRTYYAWLFKSIKKEDLLWEDGNFLPMTCDLATMMPMIEMARDHFKFIPHILYIYNNHNPISDHMVDAGLQKRVDEYVRGIKPYKPL